MNFIIINIFFILISLHFTKQIDLCTKNSTLKDVPGGALPQLLRFLTGFPQQFFGCNEIWIPKNAVKFYLYTRNNIKEPIILNTTNLHKIDNTKKIIFLLHGWLCNSRDGGMPQMKNAYLLRYDSNVIIVDWSVLTITSYPESVCSIQPAAKILANFVCKMHTLRNVKIESIHMVGHSLGAHLAGVTGQLVREVCGRTIGRITGLDPSGPYFQDISINKRLDESDANMVDVIHSNMGLLGYYGSCGTIDFFPNCGVYQPGCFNLANLTSIPNFLDLPLWLFACNHIRSVEFMVESIVHPSFVGKRCDLCPGIPLLGLCSTNIFPPFDTALMGENCPKNTPGSKYYVATNSEIPYAQKLWQ